MDIPGILDNKDLPDNDFRTLWDTIILDTALKDRLLYQAVLNFTLRGRINRAVVPLHGVILLVGEPGTGKTSLARGLATRISEVVVTGKERFLYLEVEPHSLASASLGKSQQAVTKLLETVGEYAATRPVVVLLDEVETLAADRSKLSLEANPVDVHRATDAVLAQLDHLASKYPRLLFIATSNFPQAIDSAFLSRADLIVRVDLPGEEACRAILRDTLQGFGKDFPEVVNIITDRRFEEAARLCVGLDGRRIRKIVVSACTYREAVALDPNNLTIGELIQAIQHEQENFQTEGKRP